MSNESWGDEKTALLKKLWGEGMSASQCAERIGGVTRNAVISKVHRLKLPHRATNGYERRKNNHLSGWQRMKRQSKPAKKPAAPKPMTPLQKVYARSPQFEADGFVPAGEELVIPPEKRKTVLTIEAGECRWPIDDPRSPDFHFCARPQVPGLPYCRDHCVRAYQPPKPSRKEGPASPITVVVMPEDVDA